jgi:hypothetical protein
MNETRLRHYLLGILPEPEAEALEERLLEDEELFVTLRSVEDDLLDDFANGRLDDSALSAFRQRYRGRRLTFARALAHRGTNVVPISRRWWIAAAAAAALVIALLIRVEEKGPRLSTAARTTTAARARASVVHTVSIALGTSRSAGGPQAITVPRDATALDLRVRVDPEDKFARYSLELRAADGSIAARADRIQALSEGGELVLPFVVPASSLRAGSYELAVHGDAEPLGFASVEVHR